MSNEQMTLTAEEIFFQHTEGTHYAFFSEEDRDAFYVEMPRAMEAYANQQAAQVQEELEQVKAQRGELSKWVKHLKPFVILPAEIKREIETLLSSLEK